ncbi:MAG TPA: aldose epimerase family protein [Flavobacterium sp.]|nr:aldose epimerase family protein [Flavobacterium sp.]
MEKNRISHFEETYITKSFGTLPNGQKVFSIVLINKNGVELSVMNYGATITSLKFPLSDFQKIDVVLGFDNVENYMNSFDLPSAPYLGAVIGRYAGRIKNGTFSLNGAPIQLNQNHGDNHLHGGTIGFSQGFWDIKNINTGENPSITLAYGSAGNEENYPGNLSVEVTYQLTDANELNVAFHAKSDEDTIVNLTQHSYFNLDGHLENIGDQRLYIHSGKMLETAADNVPTGNLIDVQNTPFDFSTPKKCPHSIDNTFVLKPDDKPAATLCSESTNLKMSVYTNQPAVHVYVGGNCFGKIKGKENADYHSLSGICFETQNFPDAPNHDNFPSAVLKKGELYIHETTFKFELFNSML